MMMDKRLKLFSIQRQNLKNILTALTAVFIIIVLLLLFSRITDIFSFRSIDYGTDSEETAPAYMAKVSTTDLELGFPAKMENIAAVGFHEADRKGALGLLPSAKTIVQEKEVIKQQFAQYEKPVFILMGSRDRKQTSTSAMDIALKENEEIISPVEGYIKKITKYKLYNKYEDLKIEICPKNEDNLKVVIFHLKDVSLDEGEKIEKGDPIGRVRKLTGIMDTQINEYLPSSLEHIHIQVEEAGRDE